MKSINPPGSTHTGRSRDAALRRLTRVNRWMIAGSALLTGVLTDVAANAFPGHKTTARSATRIGQHPHALKRPSGPPRSTTTQAAPPPPEPQAQSTPAPAESSPAPAEETNTTVPEAAQQAPPETHVETREEVPAPERSEAPVVSGGS